MACEYAMSSLDHMFDDHSLYHISWCHKKLILDEGMALCPSKRDDKGYYCSNDIDAALYGIMK